ncbi:putative cyclase [Obba rivulosa]|uniref:Putative cyclase n=1 Tax=Obba rivulosa TaxID=1052685 RepID=A0A8E2DPP3_9APHY|nr:putative cyclase [Obba rivulosa]
MNESPDYVDLTHLLDDNVQIYPGDPKYSCCPALTISNDGLNVQTISMGSHTGTHVDAPYHFFEDGIRVDELPISTFVARVLVVDLTSKQAKERISWADLAQVEDEMRRLASTKEGVALLLRTGWSRHWGSPTYFDHPFLERDAAEKIIQAGVRILGVDTLSPDETRTDGSTPDFGVHEIVLGAGAVIAENLNGLEVVCEGEWVVYLVPLKLAGGDGSPVRAFASRVRS